MSDLQSIASVLDLADPRAAFFGRVSDKDLQDPSISIPRQNRAAAGAADAVGAKLVAYYWDIESGRKELATRGNGADTSAFSVPLPRDGGLLDLLDAAARREFDIVIVESIDRISRVTADATHIEQRLQHAGVLLLAADEPKELNPTTILTRRVKQAIAEFYVLELAQKSWAGMSESTRQGWHTGGPAPYGYALEEHPHPNPNKAREGKKKHRLIADPVRSPVVRQIFAWYCDERRGLGEICQRLNADPSRYPAPTPSNRSVGDLEPTWSRATIQAILRNPKYTGRNVWNRHNKRRGKKTAKPTEQWVWSDEVTHEPIISRELFEKVPLIASANSARTRAGGARKHLGEQTGRSPSRTYPLRGRVFCEICGRRLGGTHQKGGNWYRCQFIDGRSPAAAATTGHPKSLQVKEQPILDAIFDFLGRRVFSPDALDLLAADLDATQVSAGNDLQREIESLRARHGALQRQIDRLWVEIKKTDDPDDPIAERARAELRSLASEQKDVEAQISEFETLRRDPAPIERVEDAVLSLPDLSAALASYSPDELVQLFEVFDLRVRYDRRSDSAEVSVALIPELLRGLSDPKDDSTGHGGRSEKSVDSGGRI